MSELSDALRRSLKSIPHDAKVVEAPEGLPLVVESGTHSNSDAVRATTAHISGPPGLIIVDAIYPFPWGTSPFQEAYAEGRRIAAERADGFEAIRAAAANPNHHSMVIFFDFDDDLAIGTRPDTGDLNQEEIRRILEMSANWPLRIRPGTSEE